MSGIISKSGCADGASKMGNIIARAPGDIAHRLWTLYWLVRMTHTSRGVVELGVRHGDSTRAILAACLDVGTHLWSFDIEDCSRVVDDEALKRHWCFKQENSVKAEQSAVSIDGAVCLFDMVFIDTDHTYATTRDEAAAWHKHVRVGGCIAFHDYWLDREPEGRGVKIAVDEFFGRHQEDWMLETQDAYNDVGFAILWRIK